MIKFRKNCLAVPENHSCCLLDASNGTVHPKILRGGKTAFNFVIAPGLTSIIV